MCRSTQAATFQNTQADVTMARLDSFLSAHRKLTTVMVNTLLSPELHTDVHLVSIREGDLVPAAPTLSAVAASV